MAKLFESSKDWMREFRGLNPSSDQLLDALGNQGDLSFMGSETVKQAKSDRDATAVIMDVASMARAYKNNRPIPSGNGYITLFYNKDKDIQKLYDEVEASMGEK